MPEPTIARPYGTFSDILSSYQESMPRQQFAMRTSSAITGNAPVIHIPHATAPTGRVTVALAASSPLLFAGIADTSLQGTSAAANDIVQVVTYGLVRQVVSSGAITAGQGVQCSTAATGTVVVAGTNDNPVIGIAMSTAASNKVDVFVIGAGVSAGASSPNGGVMSFPITLANVANGDVLTNFTPGFAGTITKVDFAVTTAVTTPAKLTTLNMEIGTTNLTGGAVALTSANCTPLGAVVAGSAVTAANFFTATDTISIEASATTAFVEGEGILLVSYT